MEKRRVVITGMGTVNPVGNSVAESWEAVQAGTCGIGPITRYDASGRKVQLAGEVKNLDLEALLGCRPVKLFARELFVRAGTVISRQWEHRRLALLQGISAGKFPFLVATIEGLLQRTLPPRTLKDCCRTLKPETPAT